MAAPSRSRRRLIAGTAAAVALAGTGVWARRMLSGPGHGQRNALRIPPLVEAARQGQAVALQVQAGETEFFPGRRSATLGYNGSYLGPTLRLRRGDDVQVTVTNGLREDTTVHWHGLLVPGHLDGGPHQNIAPGASWRPVLPVRQPAATLFYHPHVHGETGRHVGTFVADGAAPHACAGIVDTHRGVLSVGVDAQNVNGARIVGRNVCSIRKPPS